MSIDMHDHYIPADFIAEARRNQAIDNIRVERRNGTEWVLHPQGYHYPLALEFHDLEAKLAHMDRHHIDVSVLSVSPTLLPHWIDAADATEFARRTNEMLAQFVAGSGGRLYGTAMVPLQDPEAAAAELRRAVTELDLRGVQIGTTMEDIPLDDPRFDVFFAAAAELDVPVSIHPYYVGARPQFADFYMTNLIGNPLETGVAASRMILSGFLDRHPNLKVNLMHAGGFMPYQIGRLDHGFKVRRESSAHISQPPSTYLRRFYYDTITHAPTPLRFLVDLVGADHVLLGTDIPFDMQDLSFADYLGQIGLHQDQLAAINGANASALYRLGI
jgi:aminocarboxymuconate-semialdehyde decarboxylase